MSTPTTLAKPTISGLVDLTGKTAIVTGGSMGIDAASSTASPGLPDDMGRVALFLACELFSYLTGSQIVADGGMLLR